MIYPNNINKNCLIGVTATSTGITKKHDIERFNLAKENLLSLGYKVLVTNNVFTNSKFVSSSGLVRANEFLELWKNNGVMAISQVRGGEFLMEMIPYIDDNIIRQNNPKWVFGYSDSSLLNFYITTKYDIATINSPNFFEFAINPNSQSLEYLFNTLKNNEIEEKSFLYYEKNKSNNRFKYNLDTKVKYKSLYNNSKVIQGRLIGGCLEAISEIIGTKYDFVKEFIKRYPEGFIWYLDIYNSNPLELNRLLFQMKEALWFKNINGILIGRTNSKKRISDLTYKDVLHKIFDDMNIPVFYDIDIGHTKPQLSIINGSLGTFYYQNGKGILKQIKK